MELRYGLKLLLFVSTLVLSLACNASVKGGSSSGSAPDTPKAEADPAAAPAPDPDSEPTPETVQVRVQGTVWKRSTEASLNLLQSDLLRGTLAPGAKIEILKIKEDKKSVELLITGASNGDAIYDLGAGEVGKADVLFAIAYVDGASIGQVLLPVPAYLSLLDSNGLLVLTGDINRVETVASSILIQKDVDLEKLTAEQIKGIVKAVETQIQALGPDAAKLSNKELVEQVLASPTFVAEVQKLLPEADTSKDRAKELVEAWDFGEGKAPLSTPANGTPSPPAIADAGAQTYATTIAISPLSFANSGSAVTACSISPSLPTGLIIAVEASTCGISGTATVAAALTTYTVTATAADGSTDTATVDITVSTTILPDTTPPVASTDLAVHAARSKSVDLTWSFGSDDRSAVNALSYLVLFGTGASPADLTAALLAGSVYGAAGLGSGVYETNLGAKTVGGLTTGTDYWFAVVVKDEAGLTALSNVSRWKLLSTYGAGAPIDSTFQVAFGGVFSNSTAGPLAVMGNLVFTTFPSAAFGWEPWVYDLTTKRARLLGDLNPGPNGSMSSQYVMRKAGTHMLFPAVRTGEDAKLYSTDGTPEGTIALATLTGAASSPWFSQVVNVGSKYYFSVAFGGAADGLWSTDLTIGGTTHVSALGGYATSMAVVGTGAATRVLWSDRFADALYSLDPVTAGIVSLTVDLTPQPGTTTFTGNVYFTGVVVNGLFVFSAQTEQDGNEVFVTDGTNSGTHLLFDGVAGAGSWNPTAMVAGSDKAWFSGSTGVIYTDGTPGGTSPIFPNVTYVNSATILNEELYFYGYSNPGNDYGIYHLIPTPTITGGREYDSVTNVSNIRAGTNAIFFEEEWQAYKWDGIGGHAPNLIGPVIGYSDHGAYRASIGDQYVAAGSFGPQGIGLGVTDGTPAGTFNIIGPHDGRQKTWLGLDNDTTIVTGVSTFTDNRGLWKLDAVSDTLTNLVPPSASTEHYDIDAGMTKVGSDVYYMGWSAGGGEELWKTNGTGAGSSQLKDINPGVGDSNPYNLTADGSMLRFVVGDDGSGNRALYQSNGTLAGTTLIKQVWSALNLTPTNQGLYYVGSSNGAAVYDLCTTNGTSGGTVTVKAGMYGATGFLDFAGTVFFEFSNGEVWITDGTSGGTVKVADTPELYAPLHPMSDRLVLTFRSGVYGNEPHFLTWSGAAATVTLLKDIYPSGSSDPVEFVAFNAGYAFVATSPTNGRELWYTDGTPAGTVQVKDLNPGTASSSPGNLIVLGGKLYFTATDGTRGYEIFESDGTVAGTRRLTSYTTLTGEHPGLRVVRVDGDKIYAMGQGSTAFTVLKFPRVD